MTIPAPALVPAQAELKWLPDGGEPQACDSALASDRYCVSDVAYGARFTRPGRAGAQVTVWLYATGQEPGWPSYGVACRYRLACGPWQAYGTDHARLWFAKPESAIDAALDAVVALACGGTWGGFPVGLPACLSWNGVPPC